MSKLTNKEIDNLINQENSVGENLEVMQNGAGVLPRDARSVFNFEISQSVGDVLSNILHPKKKDWWYVG